MTTPYSDAPALRQTLIDTCRRMNDLGLNQGTAGNISVRCGETMLITPSGVPYDRMTPQMIVPLPLAGGLDHPFATPETPSGVLAPSSEWRFHKALLQARPDMQAVVHAHPVHCTALAMTRQEIPACHYMVAIFGGKHVPLAPYALFGSAELASGVVTAMGPHHGCLMANHGATVLGETLDKGLWRLEELEALARGYLLSLQAAEGGPHLLSDAEMDAALVAIGNYGLKTTA
ncbi:MAG: class II aldolase/adducin family protein [Rhodobacteraceae bacterium]|nr:class II aldolase/adducin family protein [Paracoccaceae bacterium]